MQGLQERWVPTADLTDKLEVTYGLRFLISH